MFFNHNRLLIIKIAQISAITLFLCTIYAGIFIIIPKIIFFNHPKEKMIQEFEQKMGNTNLNKKNEKFINSIAQELNISEPFIIRKMNVYAIKKYGYYNACVAFPTYLNYPISTTPYLFISENFFTDLSPEEQRFLIGHELIHLKEKHLMYFDFMVFIIGWIIIYAVTILSKNFIIPFFRRKIISRRKGNVFIVFTIIILWIFLGLTIAIAENYYRYYYEKRADSESLKILKTTEGCLKILDRWEKQFDMKTEHSYYGLLSDHPSHNERRKIALALQNHERF